MVRYAAMGTLSPGEQPLDVTRFDVESAAALIGPWVRQTPVAELEPHALGVPGQLVLKLELLQHTGSVLAASGGNFGLGVAYAARQLGHPAEIFVPSSSPEMKIAKIRSYGATVHVIEGFYPQAFAACEERAFDTGAAFLHPYDQPAVVAGQGTLARELSDQVPAADTVIAAVGGGGLIGGIAAWFASDVTVIGVETEGCPTMSAALEAGEPVDVEVGGIATDSLGAGRAGMIGFAIAQRHVTRMLLVSDEAIARARALLWDACRVAAEPGAAAPLAALLTGAYVPEDDERVVLVISGGNADPGDLSAPAAHEHA